MRKVEDSPAFGANDAAPADTGSWVTAAQDILLPVAVIALAFFLGVFWLAFDHPDLQAPVIGLIGTITGWAASSVSHRNGAATAIKNVQVGLHHRE